MPEQKGTEAVKTKELKWVHDQSVMRSDKETCHI